MTAGSPARRRIGGSAAVARRHRGRARRHRGRLQDRPADPLAHRFCQDRRDPRYAGRLLCLGHATVQHDDSMGRLTLNILLSFAQFEREVIGERIRDKIAASKRKGMWMGGVPPLGYRVRDRRLVIVDGEAEIVRTIFRRYAELGSVRVVEGGARGPRDQKQVVDERLGSPDRRQAILARCALPDAAGPPLSRRDRSQGTIPPRRTPANHRSAAVEYGSGAACRLAEDEGCAAGKATHRPTSSCDCSFFLCLAASRTRASAWVTRSRLCVRCVLCWSAFPLVPGLGSANSATSRQALFIGFIATMSESDFSGSCISGFGSCLPATDHPATTAPMPDPEISRFPRKERPYMPGSETTPGLAGARNDAPASVAFREVNNVGTRVSNALSR